MLLTALAAAADPASPADLLTAGKMEISAQHLIIAERVANIHPEAPGGSLLQAKSVFRMVFQTGNACVLLPQPLGQ
jgi:hypothetical protein